MKNKSSVVIRGGTPDCDWGFPMPDLGEVAFNCCYIAFREHCTEIHGLTAENASGSWMFLKLEEWTLALIGARRKHLSFLR